MKRGRDKTGRRWLSWEGRCREGKPERFTKKRQSGWGQTGKARWRSEWQERPRSACGSQSGTLLCSRRHKTMCKDTFGYHNWEVLLASAGARDATQHPAKHTQSPPQRVIQPQILNAEVGKPGPRGVCGYSLWALFDLLTEEFTRCFPTRSVPGGFWFPSMLSWTQTHHGSFFYLKKKKMGSTF